METISARCSRNIRNIDGLQESEIFLETSQAKRMTGKMVSEVALWLCTTTYFREDKYESKHPIEKGPSQYKKDNKDVQLLKDEMWTRKTTIKITMLGRKTMTEESDIIKKIWKNNIREKEILQALEKKDGLA